MVARRHIVAAIAIAASAIAVWPALGQSLAPGTEPRASASDATRFPVLAAAGAGNLAGVESALTGGANVNESNGEGISPLIIAAYAGHIRIVEVLLGAGANPNHLNKDGESALHTSAASPHAGEIVSRLIGAGGRIEVRDRWGRTPLKVHAQLGRTNAVKALLDAKADVAPIDKDGWMPVHAAAGNGHTEVLETLLAAGASVAAPDGLGKGNTPLLVAAYAAQSQVVTWLMAHGANPREQNKDGNSAMTLAVGSGSWLVVKALIEAGVTLVEPVGKPGAALHVAAQFGKTNLIKPMVEAGAKVDHAVNGFTPMMWAVVYKQQEVVAALLDYGTDPNLASAEVKGLPPLLLAALAGNRPAVELLLARGADIERRNPQGGTALRSAADAGHIEIVKLLLDKGAKASVRDTFGRTPLDYAREKGHAEIVKLLIAAK